jgi:hypothetical protein
LVVRQKSEEDLVFVFPPVVRRSEDGARLSIFVVEEVKVHGSGSLLEDHFKGFAGLFLFPLVRVVEAS